MEHISLRKGLEAGVGGLMWFGCGNGMEKTRLTLESECHWEVSETQKMLHEGLA